MRYDFYCECIVKKLTIPSQTGLVDINVCESAGCTF